jgi:hypothetical protein
MPWPQLGKNQDSVRRFALQKFSFLGDYSKNSYVQIFLNQIFIYLKRIKPWEH